MTTINKFSITKIVAALVLFLALIPNLGSKSLALTCDPLPTDTEQLLECNLIDDQTFPNKTYEQGTDPENPATFPFSGIGGIGSAYSDKSESLLVVGQETRSGDSRQILGVLADPKTLAVKTPVFRIDSNGTAGSPKVVYGSGIEKFLVVWEDSRPCANCRSTYGRFISPNGVPDGTRDFVINSGAAFLMGVAYDPIGKKFVVTYDNVGNSIAFRTVDAGGTVSAATTVVSSFAYQGQGGVAVNTSLNEYWFAYSVVVAGDSTDVEDDRAMMTRIDAVTLKAVSEPVQLSQTRVGHNALGGTKIAYSTSGGGAVIMWLERGREGVAGMWGRTMYDDGTLSSEYPVITLNTFIYSEGYSSDAITYNPWTKTFFVFSGDWDGYAEITEIDLTGLIYDNDFALSPFSRTSLWDKIKSFAINVAHAATGSFNITGAVTPNGAVTLASKNYLAVAGTSYASINAPGPKDPPPPDDRIPSAPADATALPKLINQLYVWGLGLSVLLAFLMMVLGGYYIMTAAGNAEQATKGKEYITSAIIGVVIIFTAYLLLNEINPDLVNLNLGSLNKF